MSFDIPNLFQYRDYKIYLRLYSDRAPRGFITRLAESAPCQRSYLSKVIGGDIHITTDQCFNISRFLNHNEIEQEYFFALVEHARASSKVYRSHLMEKLNKLREQNEDISHGLKRNTLEVSDKGAYYYASYLASCIHILISIPEFQKPQAICKELFIPMDLVNFHLEQLVHHGFAKKEKETYKFLGGSLHVTKHSPYVTFHHQNWRQQAVLNSQRRQPSSVHYTNVQSMSLAAFEMIRQDLLKLIQRAADISGPSKEEVLVSFLADLFVVGAKRE